MTQGILRATWGLISSIDDSKTAERELRKLHDRLQAVLKTSSIGIWEWSHAEGKLSWDNQMFEIYGLDPQEFKGDCTDWVERLHPEDAERVMRVDTGQQRFHGDSAMEFRILRPNGETRYIYSNVIIEQDENGDPIRTTGVNMDITDRRLTELALHKSQTQFERVVANVPGMIWQMESGDEGYEITYLSSKSREMFEVTPDEALADNCALRQYIHPDDLEPYLAGQRTAIANRTSFDLEFRIDLPEQGLRWRQCSAHPSVKEDGEVVWNGMTIDITDRKSAEIALQEAQERIQRITDHVPGMVYRYVVKPNRPVEFIYVGSESLAMFGVEPEELLKDGEKIKGWIHPEDFDELVIKRRDAKNAELQSIEYRVVTPDRGVRWYRSYCQPEFLDNGDVIWDGVVIDVTESKHIQLALQESQTQFERMTKNVPGMIYRYVRGADNSHWFTYVSQQVQEMYEIGPEVALADADKLFTVLHPDDVDRVQKATIESATALTPFVEEFRVRLPKQGLRWRKAVSQPSRTANGDVIWDGIVIDITDKKLTELRLKQANEELEHATKMKDVFLANMSHELRTPLSAILSTAEGLQMGLFGAPTKKQSESYEVICQSGTHLLNLIDEVLDLARIESGAIRLEFSSVELSTLCASCLKFVAGQAKLKSINLELNAVDLPTIEADEKRLRQILLNLLSNAIKFTPEGGKVTLEVHHLPDPSNEPNGEGREEAGDRIQFLVSDTGIGISASRLDSIFEPFVQIESTLSRNYEGSGLGLSLVKQFAELHRGQVYVTSKPGVGSCFTVELPCRISNANSRAAKTSDLVEARQHLDSFSVGNSALILVVEDNKLLAETTQNFLRAANFRVKIVSSGSLALESVEEERPDAILMDIQMPGMDGFEVIHRLRENPALARTPIIALTGLAMEGDARRCMEAGADYYLSKPYRIRELVGLIQRSLTSA